MNQRGNQDQLERRFTKHWYFMWQWWLIIIIVILSGCFLYNRYQTHRSNLATQKKIALHRNEKLPSDAISSALKPKHNNTKKRAIDSVSDVFGHHQNEYGTVKVNMNNNLITEIHIPKNAPIYNEINSNNTNNWHDIVNKLKHQSKIAVKYHNKELTTPNYSQIMIINPDNPKTMLLYVMNGKIKFNAIK